MYKNLEKKKNDDNNCKINAPEDRKPLHVKDFYTNLKGIQEAYDNEDSFEQFENKLELEIDKPKNINTIKKANILFAKNHTADADSLDDFELENSEEENSPRIKKIQSGKSHIHNLINLKKWQLMIIDL